MTGFLPIGTHALLILNRLRNEIALQEQNKPKDERGDAEAEQRKSRVPNPREHGDAVDHELFEGAPAAIWNGGERKPLPGSLLAAGRTFRPRATSVR